ncbi:MAG: undecaprenyldiphospho-muramoylpentapeptide beta-N-acetylglucosaminyltransferase [Flavobacteriaceae bacterium]
MKRSKYIISGGGTGGHIYPAIAIANALKKADPNALIVFVGARGKMEMEKVPQAGYKIHGLWISGIQRKQPWRNLLFPLKLIISCIQAFVIWWRYRPDILVGTGGFASGPMLFIGNLLGSKTFLQEQNSYAGLTNKLLSKKANGIAVAYDKMERYFPKDKIHFTGNPVRSSLLRVDQHKASAVEHFGLDPAKKTVVVLGGSLGAKTINELIASRLSYFQKYDLQLLWQTGRLYYTQYQSLQSKAVVIYPFIKEMEYLYSVANFIISRAGAASISELCVVGKPVILIPSPNVAENHQYHNARALEEKQAALVIEEKNIQADFDTQFSTLISSSSLQQNLVDNIKKLAQPNATKAIVTSIHSLNRQHEN